MLLFNLTDKTLPRQKTAHPQTLRKAGIVLEPGKSVDTPKNFMLGTIGGWITSGKVAVGQPPAWYLADEPGKEKPTEFEDPKPTEKKGEPPTARPPNEKKIKVDVGAMTATVSAGEDGELGTADDKVDIKPKKMGKKSKKGGKR